LKILRATKNESMIFTVIGRTDGEYMAEVKRVIGLETSNHNLVLDLKDGRQVGHSAIRFLARCEAESVVLDNCPAYIHDWSAAEKHRNVGYER